MTMKEAVTNVFNNYAGFSGRARRSEYWYFMLFNFLVGLGFSVLVGIFGGGDSGLGRIVGGLSGLYSLAVLIPSLAVAWRRLHDIGRPGGWFFICLVPIVGWILLLVWLAKEGDRGSNLYGADPKGRSSYTGAYAAPDYSYGPSKPAASTPGYTPDPTAKGMAVPGSYPSGTERSLASGNPGGAERSFSSGSPNGMAVPGSNPNANGMAVPGSYPNGSAPKASANAGQQSFKY